MEIEYGREREERCNEGTRGVILISTFTVTYCKGYSQSSGSWITPLPALSSLSPGPEKARNDSSHSVGVRGAERTSHATHFSTKTHICFKTAQGNSHPGGSVQAVRITSKLIKAPCGGTFGLSARRYEFGTVEMGMGLSKVWGMFTCRKDRG